MKAMTTQEAAKEVGITRMGIIVSIKRGRLRAEKLGRDWLIQESDFSEFLKSRKPSKNGHRRVSYTADN